ncbi:Uu.00g008160.m01.CDS01 [Anthostomella pinea]|uniref:Uu.00g008160.m01.CDS01 n=1 Tax=Anthostomella pinea TaxID=933095 RepID=A0AAI8VX42_9PEZI|nr:Uu.00g008160.m01.CDS01 [Anthostomella pinea]
MAKRRNTHNKKQKDKVWKRGTSLQKKTVELGEIANVLIALIYWNPTHNHFEKAVHVPKGQSLPDATELTME